MAQPTAEVLPSLSEEAAAGKGKSFPAYPRKACVFIRTTHRLAVAADLLPLVRSCWQLALLN